jgi:hypothetical protein
MKPKKSTTKKVIAAVFFAVFISACGGVRTQEITMTLKTYSGMEVRFGISGATTVNIDWGDGNTENKQYEPEDMYDDDGEPVMDYCEHEYLTASDHTVTITGDNIMYFDCSDNALTSLDVSKNTSLTHFNCSGNQLQSLDVSKNIALTHFFCDDNQLINLDINKNTLLRHFICSGNRLTDLNVGKHTDIITIWCSDNQLTVLDVSKNTALRRLDCSDNRLTALDAGKNTALIDFDCYGNKLNSLDVGKNTVLAYLNCGNNNFSASALNALFETLHNNDLEFKKIIKIYGNSGSKACNTTIAKDKGWNIFYHLTIE